MPIVGQTSCRMWSKGLDFGNHSYRTQGDTVPLPEDQREAVSPYPDAGDPASRQTATGEKMLIVTLSGVSIGWASRPHGRYSANCASAIVTLIALVPLPTR